MNILSSFTERMFNLLNGATPFGFYILMKISCLRRNILFSPDCFRIEQLPSILGNGFLKKTLRQCGTRRKRADSFERTNREFYSRLLEQMFV